MFQESTSIFPISIGFKAAIREYILFETEIQHAKNCSIFKIGIFIIHNYDVYLMKSYLLLVLNRVVSNNLSLIKKRKHLNDLFLIIAVAFLLLYSVIVLNIMLTFKMKYL